MKAPYTKDWLEELRVQLVKGLNGLVDEDRIYKFSIPDELIDDEVSPVMKITQVGIIPSEWAGNDVVAYTITFLIDVWHEDYTESYKIAQTVEFILRQMSFKQSSPIITDDPDTKLYRNSRTYSGNISIK